MNESEVLETPDAPPFVHDPKKGRDRAAVCILGFLLLLLALAALPERLQVGEAQLLVRLLDEGAAATFAPVERTWSFVVGTMERPSRLLGVLSASLALILTFQASRGLERGGRSAALLGLCASGLFWRGGLEIGAAGFYLALGAGLLALLRGLRWSPVWSALGSAAAAGALPFLLQESGARIGELAALAARTPADFLPANLLVGLAAAALVTLILLAGLRGALIVAVIILGVGPTLLAQTTNLENCGSLMPALMTLLPALGLACGIAVAGPESRREPMIILLGFLALIAAAAAIHERMPATGNDRARLDQAATLLPNSGWMAICGERAPVLRYYERVGHRSAARSFLITDAEAAEALVGQAMLDQPPALLLIDADQELIASLEGRYRRIESAELAPGITLFEFRRR